MEIDPKVEQPLRKLLGHTMRGKFNEMIALADSIGEHRFLECLALCLLVAVYRH